MLSFKCFTKSQVYFQLNLGIIIVLPISGLMKVVFADTISNKEPKQILR